MDSAGGGNSDEKSLESGGHHHHHHHPGHNPHRNNQYQYSLFDKVSKIALVFSSMALACLILYNSSYTFQFFPTSFYNPSQSPSSSSPPTSAGGNRSSSHVSPPANTSSLGNDEEDIKLESVLKKAAMEDKTVILTTLNEAWAAPNSVFDLFLQSFRIGNQTEQLLNHVVVVALDKKAYARCLQLRSTHCYALSTPGIDFSGEAYFMTTDYLKMMWRRIDFLRNVLDIGYNFIFTDADVMWLRDPFVHFYSNVEFQIACDHFYGDPSDLNNSPNGGFNYVKSSNKTIQFYKFWYKSRENYPEQHDQDVLNTIKFDPFVTQLGLQIRFLDTAFFGGFCEPSKDLNLVCTMHANCCIGLDNKIHDLKLLLEDWTKYMSSPTKFMSSSTNATETQQPSWTPRICG